MSGPCHQVARSKMGGLLRAVVLGQEIRRLRAQSEVDQSDEVLHDLIVGAARDCALDESLLSRRERPVGSLPMLDGVSWRRTIREDVGLGRDRAGGPLARVPL